ncbi:FERM domain-containing protein 8-like isoform X2 [Actinia tenebrosa]|nr:FERM domain-containing protein 8-like isoform X2 [Actinia tenebrosa]
MATSIEKAEDVELKAVTGQEHEEPKKKGPGLKLKTQDFRKETKQSAADYKRAHSYPEDKRSIIKKSKQKSHGSHPEIIQRLQSQQAMTVAVFLVEKAARLLNLEDGKNATAGTMKRIMMENLSLQPDAEAVFCIWLKSPLLQLQLKDHHIPYKLRKVWPELLKKFTNANDEAIEMDEPILCYQRNSFYPLSEEKKVKDAKVIRRLFEEAKFNVMSGTYPVSKNESMELGGMLAVIENGKFKEQDHKLGFFKDKLTEYLPVSACKVGWTLPGRRSATRNTLEQQLLDKYKEVSNRSLELRQLYRSYLEKCWTFPYYGSVFFAGQIEKPPSILSSILGKSDLAVGVAVNREKIHIIDEAKNEILLSLGFDELSWDYTPAEECNKDCLDTFWLEFDSKENDGTTTVQRLQIFSKQAVMIDALVQSCVECEDEIQEECCQNIGGDIRCRMDRLSLSKLESSLARKKKTNVSFNNPFSRPKRLMSDETPKQEKT